MTIGMLSVLSLLPIIAVVVFLVVLRRPISWAMPVCYFLAVALALLVWRAPGLQVAAASMALVFTVPMVQVFINTDGGLYRLWNKGQTVTSR